MASALVVVVAAFSAPAAAQASHHFWSPVTIECVSEPNPYGEYLIAAKATWRVGTTRHKKNNLTSMTVKARLIPTSAGANYFRGWSKAGVASPVSADGANSWDIFTTTATVSSNADWNLEVKLRWNRRGKRDWRETEVVTFDESFCATDEVY